MSISPVNSLCSSSLLQLGTLNSTQASLLPPGVASSATSPTDPQGIPSFTQLMSQLQKQATSDPSAFKQQTAAIAANLSTAAQSATGSQAAVLQDVATQFQTASQTGNPSALPPTTIPGPSGTQTPSKHHHHYHPTAPDQSQQNSTSSADITSLLTASQTTASSIADNLASITGNLGSSLPAA